MAAKIRVSKAGDIPRWSWIAASAGLLLVVSSAGFLLYRAVAAEASPPELVIDTEPPEPAGSGYRVEVRVRNRGGSAAAGLVIEGELKAGEEALETSSITIDYVPAGSERKAGLIFGRDPRRFELKVQAKGYQEP